MGTRRSTGLYAQLRTLRRDLRYGLRRLHRDPGFSIAAIAVAGLGIAAASVVFCFAQAALFGALPYRNASRLVAVDFWHLRGPAPWRGVPIPVFLSWNERANTLAQLAASGRPVSKTLVGGSEPIQAFDQPVTEGAFPLLGVRPFIGRDFIASDYAPGGPGVVMLSFPLWQEMFGGRRGAIGRTIMMDGVGHTIVGIAPPGFMTPGATALEQYCWTPLVTNSAERSDSRRAPLTVWARLKRGVTPARAQAALSGLARQEMSRPGGPSESRWRIQLKPLRESAIERWHSPLVLLLGAIALLLATACANVAGLLLMRARTRHKEIAVRFAVGANRARVAGQLLAESAVLGGAAGLLGILLARWGIELVRVNLPRWLQTPNFQQMGVDRPVAVATLVTALAVGIASGLVPAVFASRLDIVESLKETVIGTGARKTRWNVQGALVVAEVALSSILLMGSGAMLLGFLRLRGVDLGFNARQVLTMRVIFPNYQYPKPNDQVGAYQELLRSIEAIPGVRHAAFVTPLPLAGAEAATAIPSQPGVANPDKSPLLAAELHAVSPGYFAVMDIPLLRGRLFSAQDREHSENVAIVDREFVDHYWPRQNPVGKTLFLDYPNPTPVVRVMGEVGSTRDVGLKVTPRAQIYTPFTQMLFGVSVGAVVIKTPAPAAVTAMLPGAVHSVDPQAPISRVETMQQVVSESVAADRLFVVLVWVFASLALLLASAGLASTAAYAVSQREHEIGIRMALGATRLGIVFLLVRQVMGSVIVGIALGLAGSLILTRFLAGQFYGVSPFDPYTFVGVSFVLVTSSAIASLIPGARAASVHPAQTLRAL